MYNETVAAWSKPRGPHDRIQNVQHFGTSDLDTAKKTVLEFRDLASQGKHFLNPNQWPNVTINSAWIEVETRDAYPF
jgi:hypothetical protein